MFKDITALYVEDEEIISKIISDFFTPLFKEFITASDGQEGLDTYKENQNKIDIVITDINMPKLDGLEMSAEIRKLNQNIPIIITTAHNDKQFLHNAIGLGVKDFVLKPVNVAELLQSIKNSLEPTFLRKKLENERKLHEEERIKSAKALASGQLAAGITHEINTPLTYIKANFEMINYDIEDLEDGKIKESMKQSVAKIDDGIQRIENIMNSIKEMSEENKEEMENVNIYSTIITALTLAYNKIKHITKVFINNDQFDLNMDLNKYEFISFAQKQRIEQVWLIIITNALDELVKVDNYDDRRLDIDISYDKDFVKIVFKDNAGGISKDILHNVFEPFKGTKDSSGMGIGLSIAKKIINDQNNGSIKAYNEDNYAVFEIHLPHKKDN